MRLEPVRVQPEPAASQGGATATTAPAADVLGITSHLRRIAALLAAPGPQGSLTAAILGGPGSGKSYALDWLMAEVAQRSSDGAARIVAARVDARLGGDAAASIAGAIHKALLQPAPGARAYPALAQEAADANTSPEDAARKAHERLTATRRQLDAER